MRMSVKHSTYARARTWAQGRVQAGTRGGAQPGPRPRGPCCHAHSPVETERFFSPSELFTSPLRDPQSLPSTQSRLHGCSRPCLQDKNES